MNKPEPELPAIPDKTYFSIGEASELCGVQAYVLRYWETEFPQLRPLKRTGNRRSYMRKDIELVREIRRLLYSEGFTLAGARAQLAARRKAGKAAAEVPAADDSAASEDLFTASAQQAPAEPQVVPEPPSATGRREALIGELQDVCGFLRQPL